MVNSSPAKAWESIKPVKEFKVCHWCTLVAHSFQVGREGDIVGGVFQKDRALSMVWFGGHTHCRAPVRNCQPFHLSQCSGCQPVTVLSMAKGYLWKSALWEEVYVECGHVGGWGVTESDRKKEWDVWRGILENENIQICGIWLKEDKISAE